MTAGSTYTPIATTTLSSNTASVTFSSISGSYTDIILVAMTQRVTATTNTNFQVGNGSIDTGTNYSNTAIYGDGTNAASYYEQNQSRLNAGSTTANWQTQIIQFMNYSNTTTYKTILTRQSNSGAAAQALVGLWRSTSAINTVKLYLADGNNFLSGSTFTLYGILSA